ncbi:GNAT family N-acetyltransferase [Lacticaseibacillus hulanensis]|uniref:GNAT family N-acetyltransferase n=1 Tax=Lacticaseibacillus hulanensis TaxID=2493111 RepID=UPI000FDAEA6F|nr:GNAT family N-acetyltransferase [Lacticaseibacillus hulanensis]
MTNDDAAAICAYSRMPQVYVPAAMIPPHDEDDVLARIRNFTGTDQMYVVVLDETGAVIGNIDLYWQIGPEGEPDLANRELGYALSPEYWHRGVMTDALAQVLRRAFAAEVENVHASVYADNVASIKLLLGLGFKQHVNPMQPGTLDFTCTATDFAAAK